MQTSGKRDCACETLFFYFRRKHSYSKSANYYFDQRDTMPNNPFYRHFVENLFSYYIELQVIIDLQIDWSMVNADGHSVNIKI